MPKKPKTLSKKNPPKTTLADQSKSIVSLFKKNLSGIATLIVVAVISYTFITVNSILSVSDDPTYRQEQSEKGIHGSFDHGTIDKISNLRSSSDSSAVQLPSGRVNPFVE